MAYSRREFLKAGMSFAAVQALSSGTLGPALGSGSQAKTVQVNSVNLEIVGAHFDPERKDLILIGRQNHLYPTPIYADDLVAITGAVLHTQGDAIGVSIDRGPRDDEMIVNYFPEDIEPFLRDTRAGDALWKSDFLLKAYGLNKDPRTGKEMTSSVSRYRSEADYHFEQMIESLFSGSSARNRRSASGWHRLWFEPFMRVVHSANSRTMVLDNPVMLVRTERVEFDAQRRPVRNLRSLESSPATRAYARQMTRLFNAFATDELALRRLAELGKLVKFARWVLDTGIPIDSAQMEVFPIPYQETPRTVPTATVSRSFDFGWMRYYTSLYGGVNLIKRNDYSSKNAIRVRSAGSSGDPPQGFTTWRIEVDGQEYVAASVSSILGVR